MLGRACPRVLGRLAEHHAPVGDQHLIAPVDPQQQRVRPTGDARRRRRCAARRRGRRRPATAAERCAAEKSASWSSLGVRAADVQQPVAELEGVDLRRRRRAAAPRRARRRARCRAGAAASRRPPCGSTSRSAIANPAIGGQQVLHHLDDARRLPGDAEQPARRLRRHHGGVGAGLLAADAGSRLPGPRR